MTSEDPRSIPDADLDAFMRELARVDAVPVQAAEPWAQPWDASRFQILEKLGAGGFGVVYLARDLATDATVALKTLPVARPELIYRLKREFRALADLRHENLVSFYELFAEGNRFYFTMEYVPGKTFLRHVHAGPSLDERRLRAALAQLTAGLSVLHAAGKLHRDVKPSNVLVTPEERVVLLDFGLSTEIRQHGAEARGEQAGTPDYMSPEQTLGEPASESSDWWSVGIMLYQALTGRLPFRQAHGEPGAEGARADPRPPRELDASAPPDLSALCLSLLSRDPARRPGAREILDVLGARPAGPLPRRSAHGEQQLFGRAREGEELRRALGRVRAGEAATVLVEGASGIGKTALVERFLAEAEQTQAVVLRGRCYERERVPYQGIDSLVDELCRLLDGLDAAAAGAVLPGRLASLVRLFPVLERVRAVRERIEGAPSTSTDGREIRSEAFGAFRELLARLAAGRTLALHVDDLQWGDPDTAALLRELIRPPDAPAMLLVLVYRSEDRERSPCLRALEQDAIGGATRVRLEPLAAAAAEDLLRSLLDGRGGSLDLPRLAGESGGNPFLLHEVARFVAAEGGGASAAALDVRTVLRSRVGRLPSAARTLLETLAVAGQPVTEKVLRRAADLSGPAWDAWRLLVSERLVRFSGPPDERYVEAFHDRIRESVVAGLGPERARQCHLGLADAMERSGAADPEALALHHEFSGNRERARELTVRAAANATRALAFDRAARFLRRAIDLAPGDHPERTALLAALGEALSSAGRCIEAARAFLAAAERESPGARVRLRRRAAEQLLFAGQIDEGRKLIQSDLREHGFAIARTQGRAIASLVLRRAWIRVRGLGFRPRQARDVEPGLLTLLQHVYNVAAGLDMVDAAHGADIGTRFLLRALRVGEPHLVGLGLAVLAGFAAAETPLAPRTARLIERMRAFASSLGDRAVDGTVSLVSCIHGYFAGDWHAGLRHGDEGDRIIREEAHGLVWERWTCRAIAIWSLFFLGRWGELERRVHAARREARERGNAYGAAGTCAPFGVAAWLGRDEPGEARRALREVTGAWSVTGFQLQHYWFLMAESLLNLYDGDGTGAWAHLRDRWKSLAGSLTLRFPIANVELNHMRGACALAAAAHERPGGAARRSLVGEAARAARRLDRAIIPPAAPFAELLRAGIAAQTGDLDGAASRLEAAIPMLEQASMIVYAAAARRRLARLRGEAPPAFLPGEPVAAPDAVARMLVAGLPDP